MSDFILDEDLFDIFPKSQEILIERGGEGSGHHGHKGRQGEVGGSLPEGAGSSTEPEDYDAYLAEHGMEATLNKLKPKFARAAQNIYDTWDQNEEGFDPEYGTGGICDQIAEQMGWALVGDLGSVGTVDGGLPGEDHAWIIVYNDKEAFGVDLPSRVYESGYNYQWTKIAGVQISPDDIDTFEVDHSDLEFAEGLDEDIYYAKRASPWGAYLIKSYHSGDTERAKREHEEQRNLGDEYRKIGE